MSRKVLVMSSLISWSGLWPIRAQPNSAGASVIWLEMCEHTQTQTLLDYFDGDCYGDNLNLSLPPPTSRHLTLRPLPTNPNTAMTVGAGWRAVGWKRQRIEEGMLRDGGERWKEAIGQERHDGQTRGRVNKVGCTESREGSGDGFTGRGMSLPLISCNTTHGIRREGFFSRQSQWEQQTFPRPAEWTLWYKR